MTEDIRITGEKAQEFLKQRRQRILESLKPRYEDYTEALEAHIKSAREERGYTEREPSEYRGSKVARWASDAEAWIDFRDSVMLYGLEVLNKYRAGETVPTLDEFKENLAKIVPAWKED